MSRGCLQVVQAEIPPVGAKVFNKELTTVLCNTLGTCLKDTCDLFDIQGQKRND